MQHSQHLCKLHFLVALVFIGVALISQTAPPPAIQSIH